MNPVRWTALGLVVALFATLLACGKMAQESADICCGSHPDQTVFKVGRGRELVEPEEVIAITVTLLPYKGGGYDQKITRKFEGDQVRKLIKYFGLSRPRNSEHDEQPQTGRVTVTYQRQGESERKERTLTVIRENLLEDDLYPEITYEPLMVLNKAWLDAMP